MTLCRRLRGHASFQPNKTAIESADGHLSYSQLNTLVDCCVDYFSALGLNQGDRVAILALNHPDWFVTLFAAAHCGVIVVPLNWRLSVEELSYIVQNSDPVLLLHDAEFAGIATKLQQLKASLMCEEIGHYGFPPAQASSSTKRANDSIANKPVDKNTATDSVAATMQNFVRDDVDFPLLIVYTSGTTGKPKGAVLTQRNLLCSAEMSQHMTDMTNSDRVLNVLPLFHVGGLNIQPLPALLYGATLVLHSRFDPVKTATALHNSNITLINTVPTLLQAILATEVWQTQGCDSLRAVSIGSTDVPVPLLQSVIDHNIPIIQVYGATETGPVAIYQRIEHTHQLGTIGKAGILCDVRLCDTNDKEVNIGESGEIQIRGDNILVKYWQNDEATQESIRDGWFCTGDVAHQDDQGFYWFDDRLKHMIISGGENIYPAEIERVIRELPGVDEAAVIGQPDERWGEVPVAVIVGSATSDVVLQACERLAKFKRPRVVQHIDALPRNALGKIQVQQLKEIIATISERQG